MRRGVVERNLRRLERLDDSELTIKVVGALVGMSSGGFHKRVERGFGHKDKGDIAELMEENRPELEDWPTIPDIQRLLPIESHTPPYWYRAKHIRERIGIRKVMGRVRFEPEWFCRLKTGVRSNHSKLITSDEVSDRLGIPRHKIEIWIDVLPYIQPAGKKTFKYYPLKHVVALKRELDRITKLGLLSIEQVSTELDAKSRDVLRYIPNAGVHPITGEHIYHPYVLQKYKNAVFARCTRFAEVAGYCERTIIKDASIRRRIERLLNEKIIPYERMGGNKSKRFLPPESERMVRNIYGRTQQMREQGVKLLTFREAAKKLGLNYQQLLGLMSEYGIEHLLTSDKPTQHAPTIEETLRIPYVRLAKGTLHYITTATIAMLRKHITFAQGNAVDDGYCFRGTVIGRYLAQSVARGNPF